MAAIKTRKAFTAKESQHATTSKQLVVEVDWTGMPLDATREFAMRDIVIKVQSTLRKKLRIYSLIR